MKASTSNTANHQRPTQCYSYPSYTSLQEIMAILPLLTASREMSYQPCRSRPLPQPPVGSSPSVSIWERLASISSDRLQLASVRARPPTIPWHTRPDRLAEQTDRSEARPSESHWASETDLQICDEPAHLPVAHLPLPQTSRSTPRSSARRHSTPPMITRPLLRFKTPPPLPRNAALISSHSPSKTVKKSPENRRNSATKASPRKLKKPRPKSLCLPANTDGNVTKRSRKTSRDCRRQTVWAIPLGERSLYSQSSEDGTGTEPEPAAGSGPRTQRRRVSLELRRVRQISWMETVGYLMGSLCSPDRPRPGYVRDGNEEHLIIEPWIMMEDDREDTESRKESST